MPLTLAFGRTLGGTYQTLNYGMFSLYFVFNLAHIYILAYNDIYLRYFIKIQNEGGAL